MGKAERVTVGDLELECRLWGGGVRMRMVNRELLKIGRVELPFTGYRYGVGNWCWDGYDIPDEYVVKLINYLEKQKYWDVDAGPVEACDKFEAKQPFTVADLSLLLE